MPRKSKVELNLPAGTRLDVVASQGSLAARMLNGEFDAIIVPDFPEEKGWRRLIVDSKSVEQEYFRRTGIFPTSHAITFHAAFLEKHPAAAQEMFDACLAAKNLALRDDADATYSNFAWNRQVWEEQRAVLGTDPWKFGIKGNEKPLEALVRYADEQGLLARKLTVADLFVQMDEPR
jgi:4,5-dihydroxyphthalate decarboxylase